MGRSIQAFRTWTKKLPPFIWFRTGAIFGVFVGIVVAIFALSAFLLQVLQAISTAVLALATVILA